jgi:hypothetical protein
MAGTTEASIADWLERNYQPPKLGNTALKDAPLTAWLPHDESAGGLNMTLRWDYKIPQGQGKTYSQAKTRADASGLTAAQVVLDYQTWYSIVTIDNPAIERAQGGSLSAVTDVIQKDIRRNLEGHGDFLETVMFSDGYPSLGAVNNISGSTCTVSVEDIEKWEVDQAVRLAASRTTGAQRAGAELIVTKVDRSASPPLITFNAGIVATVAAAVNGDFAFVSTSRDDTATAQTALGIAAFIPTSVSGADAFGATSFNRSVDAQRLAGLRLPIAAGSSVQQGMVDLFVRCRKYKLRPDALWCSYERWGQLISELGNNVHYVNFENQKYGLTIEGVRLFTAGGEVAVMPSPKCPDANVYALNRKSWKIASVNGALIRPSTRYQKALDSSTGDSVELRWRSFHQLACLEPMQNAVGIFQ